MPVLVAVIVALALVGKPLRAWVYDSADLSTAGTVFAGVRSGAAVPAPEFS